MTAPVVIFAVGNPSRGDDAIGPELCGRLAEWLESEQMDAQFELIEDFQLQIEHALDLQGRQLALFIDAGEKTPPPFIFGQIQASTAVSHTSHALAPEAVLQVYQQTEGRLPPPAFVLCVRGEQFDLGAELSQAARSNLAAALAKLQRLCQSPNLTAWTIECSASLSSSPA